MIRVLLFQLLILYNCLIEIKLDLIKDERRTTNNNIYNNIVEYIDRSRCNLKASDLFTLPITIETPKKSLNALLDTGPFIVWVSNITSSNQ